MVRLSFSQGIKPGDVQAIRQAVQTEAAEAGLSAQQGFIMIFVVDELVCNVMEHSRAARMDLTIEANAKGFQCQLLDDGTPFDTAESVQVASQVEILGQGERRLGLNLIGRLVDKVDYVRTAAGMNQVDLTKGW
jgi:anti-sigma regulatory factor (Ser/Thr protein kinase)